MDLETENHIAAILLREGAELRCQAEKGVRAYLDRPTVRARLNSRFLSATVLGMQQSNRAVEINEMWRVRQKELELDERVQQRSRGESSSRRHRDYRASPRSSGHKETDKSTATYFCTSATSSKREIEDRCFSKDGGLKDEELDEFLHSRVKYGRGAVGSRMDETSPPLPSDSKGKPLTSPGIRMMEDWEHCVLGPETPSSLKSLKSDEIESWKNVNRIDSASPKKLPSKKHKSKNTCGDKKKEMTSKHRCKSKNRKE